MFGHNGRTPASMLNDIMDRAQLSPKYELVFHECHRAGKVTAMMSINCPLRPNSEPLTAYSRYCGSTKAAKHSAALAYMNKYMLNKIRGPLHSTSLIDQNRRPQDRIYYEELEKLEAICLENSVDPPMYLDVSPKGCRVHTMECHVSDLVTEGTARNKVDARRIATRSMIEMLSEMGSNLRNPESPGSSAAAANHQIVSSSDDLLGFTSDDEKSKSVLPVIHEASGASITDKCSACEEADTPETLLRSLNLLRSSDMENDRRSSGTKLGPRALGHNTQRRISSTSASLHNTDSESEASGVRSSSSVDGTRKLTQLQAASRSVRTFKTLEKELINNIIDVLGHKNLPHQTTVRILRQEFLVIIQLDSPPMIFEEHGECSDQSVRMACLTKMFQDLTII